MPENALYHQPGFVGGILVGIIIFLYGIMIYMVIDEAIKTRKKGAKICS